jgi:hypothetical protein
MDISWTAKRGIRTIGIETPSFDPLLRVYRPYTDSASILDILPLVMDERAYRASHAMSRKECGARLLDRASRRFRSGNASSHAYNVSTPGSALTSRDWVLLE